MKIVFLDIDGTLTEPGKNVPPASALRAVQLARANGHKILIATGRNVQMAQPLMKLGFDGIVASTGAYIQLGDKVLYDEPMSEKQKTLALEVLKRNHIFKTVECREAAYTDDGLKEFLREHVTEGDNSELLRWREQIESTLDIRPMAEYQDGPLYKIVMMALTQEDLLRAKAELEGEDFHFYVQESNSGVIFNGELIPAAYSKGQAVQRVCKYLKLPVSDTIAMGDGMIDVDMVEAAGIGVAMADGCQRILEAADMISPPVREDGLFRTFLKLGLIDEK